MSSGYLDDESVARASRNNNNMVQTPTTVEPTIFHDANVITIQPRPPLLGVSGTVTTQSRIPIPSIQYGINSPTSPTPFIPRTGLDYLQSLASIHIQQTFELNEYLTSGASDNRFTIRSPSNEAIYAASESSNTNQGIWFGARPFTMLLLDRTHQIALQINRHVSSFCCPCQSSVMEVLQPPGDYVGCVREKFSLISNELVIENAHNEVIYQIIGPPDMTCFFPKEAHFKILSADRLTQKGTISRAWNTTNSAYAINIYFANSDLDPRQKGLLLAAGFLMEYKYFQNKKCC